MSNPIIDKNGDKFWYKEGKCHRDDGPAVEWTDGSKYWYKEGKCHRDDGPAIERANGTKYWYKEGRRHRDDGPACEWADGDKFWYIDGIYIKEENFNYIIKGLKNKLMRLGEDGELVWK